MFAAAPASAAQFTVTNNNDSGAGSLRQAVLDANASAGADEINFDAGVGTITLTSGQIEITDDLTILGPADRQTISGNGCSRIFEVATADATLQRLRLIDGTGAEACDPAQSGQGGAVWSDQGSLSIIDCELSDNRTEGFSGGAILALGDLLLFDSLLTNNSSTGGQFGGGAVLADESVTVMNSRISNNDSTGSGGGIHAVFGALLVNSVVADNTTSGQSAHGGGIYAQNVELADSTVSGNVVEGDSARGGGVYATGRINAVNSSFYDNASLQRSGGAMTVGAAGGIIDLDNATVVGNSSALFGGGITLTWPDSELNIDSTILAGNAGSFEENLSVEGVVNARNSLFGGAPSDINGANENNIFWNAPGLKDADDNGCAVPAFDACVSTLEPRTISPVRDAGANSEGLAHDQRGSGFPRVQGASADIGALEGEVPALLADPMLLDFGEGSVGDSAETESVTFTNTGGDDLVFGTLSIAGADPDQFGIGSDQCSGETLPPQAECTVEISFARELLDLTQAELLIPWNDPESPARLAMAGRGILYRAVAVPDSVDFGGIRLAAEPPSAQETIRIDNTGTGELAFETAELLGSHPEVFEISSDDCSGMVLPVAESCEILVTAAPTDLGERTATLNLASNASNSPVSVDLRVEGTERRVEVSRERIVFPPIGRVGVTTDIVGVVYSNIGSAPVEFGAPTIEGDHPGDFAFTDGNCSGQTVSPGDSCFLELNATPAEEGLRTADLILTSNAPDSPYSVELISEGLLPELRLSDSEPQITIIQGDTGSSRLTLQAGRLELLIEGIGNPQAPFTITGGSCMDLTLPATLPPFEECDILFEFEATDIGSYESSFQITSDAPSSPDTVSLRGTVRPRVVPTLGGYGLAILVLMLSMVAVRRLG
ncbi:choice-of-anchor D domain-containing protein [Wenzhouxiangella sp. EGI_FJ10305]|uniref:choice-of-anchor D domain-containing protein n=1 Tax=Wenzhouxiangella sp. EGI_FJ10305 TaxID=3243768 RepID=UPI0035E15F2B